MVATEFGKESPDWISIQNPVDVKNMLLLEAALDRGEASAIALALEKENSLLIIDEAKDRKLAKQLGIMITGTLGILAQAKQSGHIQMHKPLPDEIKQTTNFRLSEELIQKILMEVGE